MRLCHLVELWEMTLSCTEREWTSGVCTRFREELSSKQAQLLAAAAGRMDLDVLLPLFKV